MTPGLMLRPMSPKKVDSDLKRLVDYLGLEAASAVLLKYRRPSAFEPSPQDCHLNVMCQVRECGGHRQHGWILAQDKRQSFCEAIFHSVWRSPEGQMADVTPRKDLEKRVLFIPDQQRAIALTAHQGKPAIVTFSSAKMLGGRVVAPADPFTALLLGGFAEAQRLWPW